MAGMKELDKALSSKQFEKVYLFYGPETGILSEYLGELKDKFKNVIETDDFHQIAEENKYNSIFGGNKLYILRNTGLFNKKADDEFIQFLVQMFKHRTNVCVFVEEHVDDKLKQTQALSDSMKVCFDKLKEDQLVALAQKVMEQNDKKVSKDLARYIVDQCDYNYTTLINELTKLIHYVEKKTVTSDDIQKLVSRSTNSVVFDLVTYLAKGNYSRALDIYETLMLRKESPLGVITLIYRQLKLLYQIKLLRAEGYNDFDIADACDSKPFIIQKNKDLCSFDTEKILKLLQKCADLDYKIKSGQIKDVLAGKILILFASLRG